MSAWKKLRYLAPSRRRTEERDLREELQSLKDMAAPGELGNLAIAAEDARAVISWIWLEHFWQDLRYALRSMRHDKLFAALAVASLTLGIGASTATYSLMDSILLRSLPVPKPQALIIMKWRAKGRGLGLASHGQYYGPDYSPESAARGEISAFPFPALSALQEGHDVLTHAFGFFSEDALSVTVHDETDAVPGQYVTGNYFVGMAVTPAAGRLLQPADDAASPATVAVVSYAFSQQRLGGPETAVGQALRINDKPFEVVGVAPAGFFGAEPSDVPDVYLPMHTQALLDPSTTAAVYLDEHYYWMEMMGRLKPGVSLARAEASLAPRFHQFALNSATTAKQKADLPQLELASGAAGFESLRDRYAKPIYVLLCVVGLILLIACSNIANLLLARATARRREMAIRLGIGASRARIVRQLLTESVLLSTIGGGLGVALAWWSIRVLTVLLSNGQGNFTLHAELNWAVLGLTAGLSIATGLLFGLAPALQATRVDVAPTLKDGRTQPALRRTRRVSLGQILMAAQLAFSLVLLVAAGLFGRTLSELHAIPLGFNREHVLLFSLRPSVVGYAGPALPRLFEDVRSELGQVHGVKDVSLSFRPIPMGGGTLAPFGIVGTPTPAESAPGQRTNVAALAYVGPGFFKTMEMPIIAGREFTAQDNAATPKVAVIGRRLARAFGVENPIGRTLTLPSQQFEIVGVVGDSLAFALTETPRASVYFPYTQSTRPFQQMTYEVRTAGDPLDLAGPVTAVVRRVDSRLAILDMKTQAAHIDRAISREITLARLCSVFAGLALVIASVGLYGTVAFNVARRTSEIGIRMALGASARRILWMVLGDVLALAALGLLIGFPLVFAGARYVKSFMYGIAPTDPVSIAIAVGVLLASGLIASVIPARRASRIAPMTAVRAD
jgi:predicted permease